MSTNREAPKVKLVIPLRPGADHGWGAENLWAEPVGEDRYRLRNIPTGAFDASLDDVVEAFEGTDGRLTFDRVTERGGHSTYRIVLEDDTDEDTFSRRWAPLQEAGCRYESHSEEPLYAVDVPPEADIHRVYELLADGERDGIWDFEEGHCGHKVD